MPPIRNLKGQTFGRLKVLKYMGTSVGTTRHARWLCRCVCGQRPTVPGSDLLTGNTASCGCLRKELQSARATGNHYGTIHGHARRGGDSTYSSWENMLQRCTNPNAHYYCLYGGAGVRVCAAWRAFKGFYLAMGKRPQGTTLGRFKDIGDYRPGNCKWMTGREQMRERRKKFEAAAGK